MISCNLCLTMHLVPEHDGPVSRYLSRFPMERQDLALAHALEYGILKLSDIMDHNEENSSPVGANSITFEDVHSKRQTSYTAVQYPEWWGHEEHIPSPAHNKNPERVKHPLKCEFLSIVN